MLSSAFHISPSLPLPPSLLSLSLSLSPLSVPSCCNKTKGRENSPLPKQGRIIGLGDGRYRTRPDVQYRTEKEAISTYRYCTLQLVGLPVPRSVT